MLGDEEAKHAMGLAYRIFLTHEHGVLTPAELRALSNDEIGAKMIAIVEGAWGGIDDNDEVWNPAIMALALSDSLM